MPELRILIRQTSNWTLPDKKLAQDATMTLFMLIHATYNIICDPNDYKTMQTPEHPMNGGGHDRWDLPDDIPVMYDIREEDIDYACILQARAMSLTPKRYLR